MRKHIVVAGAAAALLAVPLVAEGAVPKAPPTDARVANARNAAVLDPATRFVPGELLVRFREGVSPSARAAALAEQRAQPARELLVQGVVLARVAPGRSLDAAISALSRRPDVLFAEKNWIYRSTATPNDPLYPQLWGLNDVDDDDIDAPEAWNVTTGSSNVVVAVVDTGVAYDHPDILPNLWSNPGEVVNGADDDGNGKVDDVRGWDFADEDPDPRDLEGHGTHVAGTIGARGNNALGLTGVAWNVKLMPVRALGAGGGTTEAVTNAFAYAAAEGARIVNASLGCSGAACFSQAMKNAIDAAPNTLFVVAAGNEGVNNESIPSYPCNYTSSNLVCVAATNNADGLASFSNRGATSVDLGAPGVDVLSTWPAFDVVFGDGFESAGRWTAGSLNGTPSTWGRTTERFFSGTQSGTDSPGGPYANLKDDYYMRTGTTNLTGRVGCHVQYMLDLDVEEDFDFLLVEGSTDLANWTVLGAWTGSSFGQWFEAQDDLSPFDGTRVLIRFALVSDETITGDGAHIDDYAIRCVSTSYDDADYSTISGTSMASPHVAGVAALAWARNPGVSVATVRSALLNGGDAIPSLAGQTVTGRRLNAVGTLALIPPPPPVTLTVAKAGAGSGTVTSTPAGINCGADCSEPMPVGTNVTLTAAAAAVNHFAGWSGCDSTSGLTCTVEMSSARSVTASFAPGTFADVPQSNPFVTHIEQLFARGITTGCGTNADGARLFCPTESVPRQQMAAFIVRAMGLPQLDPATPTFADVPKTNPFFGYVEQLKAQNITTGCGTNGAGQPIYCPLALVPREQLAALLMRAKAQTQLDSATPTFADVPKTNPFYGWIERLHQQGVTTGCGTNASGQKVYCPGDFVPRQQMAAFLIRAFPAP